ncbi:hypothetical protein OPV22_007784 [Ensete ventricosum]|uniref:BHLH domain-containing protein n=1 Tax=Ensete ventricosum TaxID=4639 RepID=A0AAV8RAU0_ENSVE|nr:hypothetical protein OPV22_007784 [Ensete ventricosum]
MRGATRVTQTKASLLLTGALLHPPQQIEMPCHRHCKHHPISRVRPGYTDVDRVSAGWGGGGRGFLVIVGRRRNLQRASHRFPPSLLPPPEGDRHGKKRDVIGTQLQKITLTVSEAKDASLPPDHESRSGSPTKNHTSKAISHLTQGSQETRTASAGAPGDSWPSVPGANKRKTIDPDKSREERVRRWPRSSLGNAAAEGTEAKQKQELKHVDDGSEMPKEDYVHVRARRGQATNSHSIAERLRRERISERMKYLQNLVPGCSKVTGKAVMLDEIINYVQSLQQQVEFLSMKLAAVNAQHNYGLEGLVAKEIHTCDGTLSAAGLPQEMMMMMTTTMMIHPPTDSSQQQTMQSSSWEEDLSAAMKLTNGSCALINAKPCDDFTM